MHFKTIKLFKNDIIRKYRGPNGPNCIRVAHECMLKIVPCKVNSFVVCNDMYNYTIYIEDLDSFGGIIKRKLSKNKTLVISPYMKNNEIPTLSIKITQT